MLNGRLSQPRQAWMDLNWYQATQPPRIRINITGGINVAISNNDGCEIDTVMVPFPFIPTCSSPLIFKVMCYNIALNFKAPWSNHELSVVAAQ